jgi:DNA-binding CsgD family transcriptional regulator
MHSTSLGRLQNADLLYNKIVTLSEGYFENNEIPDMENFKREAELLLKGVKGTDAVIGIFNHRTYSPVLEVGEKEFWGNLPDVPHPERMLQIMSLLEKEYTSFFTDSVKWFTETLQKIPFEQRINMNIFHCGIRYKLLDGKPICLFSKGLPIQYDANRNFTFTFNYVQNIVHLIKKDFPHYWIRISYGAGNELVHTLHSDGNVYSSKDLLSPREKEILKLIADDFDTKQIAEKLFISNVTVGHHRSNMIERLGARDTTALVQLAKMAGMI